jgi:hypothetical protein
MFSNGQVSRPTTCTATFRARSDAATSIPMKLAPITTARLALSALATSSRLSPCVRR